MRKIHKPTPNSRYIVLVADINGGEPNSYGFPNWRWARRSARQFAADGPADGITVIVACNKLGYGVRTVASYQKRNGEVRVLR